MVSNKNSIGVSSFSVGSPKNKSKNKATSEDSRPATDTQNHEVQQTQQAYQNEQTLEDQQTQYPQAAQLDEQNQRPIQAEVPSNSFHVIFEQPQLTPTRKRRRNNDEELTDSSKLASEAQDNEKEIPKPKARTSKRAKKQKSHENQLRSGRLALRINNPVKACVHEDIWAKIFTYCTPRTLLMLRTVDKRFNDLLNKYPQIWKQSRIETFGVECPPLPTNLLRADLLTRPINLSEPDWQARQNCFLEMQYADLIDGFGCHGSGCLDNARKVYWLFQRRFCQQCLMKRFSSGKSLAFMAYKCVDLPRILYSLPHCSMDSWNRYHKVTSSQTRDLGYDTNAFKAAYNHVQTLRSSGAQPDELNDWFKTEREKSQVKMAEISRLEAFFEKAKKDKGTQSVKTKSSRIAYFESRALEMEPPMPANVLYLIHAFQTSVVVPRPPTALSWEQLLPKLKEQREFAEEIAADEASDPDPPTIAELQKHEARKISRNDNQRLPGELVVLYQIADEVMEEVWKYWFSDNVPPRELVPIMLKEIRRRYKGPPTQLGTTHGEVEYTLIMDDAQKVFDLKIQPFFESRGFSLTEPTNRVYKCPICGVKKKSATLSFHELIPHIVKAHSETTTGEFRAWRVPKDNKWKPCWYSIEWPHNIPLITDPRKATGSWDLNSTEDHIMAPLNQRSGDPFHKRTVDHLKSRGFVDDVIHVLDVLEELNLGDEYKSQLAYEYALRMAMKTDGRSLNDAELRAKVPFETLLSLQERLLLGDHQGAFGKISCASCPLMIRNGVKTPARQMPLGELIKHFKDRTGHSRHDWFDSFFGFPTLEDLAQALAKNNRITEVFDQLFPR